MNEELEVISRNAAIVERSSVVLVPVMDVRTAMKRMEEFQSFIASYLVESKPEQGIDGDYGIIPGTKKSTLLKPGADKLCEVYGLYDEYETMSSVEDWEKGLFDYTLKCILRSRRDDSKVGTGVGSCSSFESKYRWREAKRTCPKCTQEFIIKGRDEYGGGWVCHAKKGGCGAKFKDGDALVEKQVVGRVENPDIIDQKNTVLKMAKKRAKIDAVIGVTRSSGIFTQDMEDAIVVTAAGPVVPVTTEDIDIGGAGAIASDVKPKGQQKPSPAPERKAKPETPAAAMKAALIETQAATAVEAAPDPIGDYIGIGQQKNIHIEFKRAVRKDYGADPDFAFYDFLLSKGCKDKDGVPTAARIKASEWFDIKEAAIKRAMEL